MNRREAIAALFALGTAGRPEHLSAQRRVQGRPARIGFSVPLSPEERTEWTAQLRALGWRENQDYVIAAYAGGKRDFASLKQNIVGALNEKPDLLIVYSTAGAIEAQRVTKTLPIVMLGSGYPVEAGVANSLARPGKNVTGNSVYAGTGIWGKHLQLLRDFKPSIKRVGILWGYVPPVFPAAEIEPCYAEFRTAASALGLGIQILEVPTVERLPMAVTAIASERPDALLITAFLIGADGWSDVVRLATERRLPTVTDFGYPADAKRLQPLLAYGPEQKTLLRQTIGYVDRILKGAQPGDLPIQLPYKFELIIDLRMAKAIGLKVPRRMLQLADRVIE